MRHPLLILLCIATTHLSAQWEVFPTEIDVPIGYSPTTVVMPPSPLDLQVIFVGGVDMVQTTATYGNEAGETHAKEWHDFVGFTPDVDGNSLGWVSVNHESIYRDDRIGDGGGMTVFRVDRDPVTGFLNVMDQELEDGRQGKYFNVDFVNTVGETGMNCGGISSRVDGRIWTAEEWFRRDNASINNGRFSNYNQFGSGPFGVGFDEDGVGSSANQGVRDLRRWVVDAPDFPFINGDTIDKYQNFNWMVEIDPRQAKAIRKQYNWGRQGFEGGTVSMDNRTIYLGVDATPAYFVKFEADLPGDFTKGKTFVYKHDAPEKWIEINNADTSAMLNFAAEGLKVGGTMYDRIEWVAINPENGLVYMTETGRDNPARSWADEAAQGAVFAPHHLARAAEQNGISPDSADYWDYYGRVLVYDPETEEVSVQIEGGPFLPEESVPEDQYPDKHMSNPDGLNTMLIEGKPFLVICEDLNGTSYGRMPSDAAVSHRLCELFLLDLAIENPTVDDLIRVTATPVGAEITGAMPTPDGKSLLVNSQHPSGSNPFPFNHSLTFAIHGFDQILLTDLDEPEQEEFVGEDFRVFPNPTVQTVHFEDMTDVALYDVRGTRLRVYRQVRQIDVGHLGAGTYFLRDDGGRVVQFVKE